MLIKTFGSINNCSALNTFPQLTLFLRPDTNWNPAFSGLFPKKIPAPKTFLSDFLFFIVSNCISLSGNASNLRLKYIRFFSYSIIHISKLFSHNMCDFPPKKHLQCRCLNPIISVPLIPCTLFHIRIRFPPENPLHSPRFLLFHPVLHPVISFLQNPLICPNVQIQLPLQYLTPP